MLRMLTTFQETSLICSVIIYLRPPLSSGRHLCLYQSFPAPAAEEAALWTVPRVTGKVVAAVGADGLKWVAAVAAETVIGHARPIAVGLCAPGIEGAHQSQPRVAVAANRAIRCILFQANGAEKVLLHGYTLSV